MASSTSHPEALVKALSHIRVETSTSLERLIHMLTADKATCIVFSTDDLPPMGFDHTLPFYFFVGCSEHRVPSIILDNYSALNVCLLTTIVSLGFGSSNFEPSSQIVQVYDSTCREVLGTLTLDLQIGPVTFSTLFQVLRIPTSFNLLLG